MFLTITEDAYSPRRTVQAEYAPFDAPMYLDRVTTQLSLEAPLEEKYIPLDAAFYLQKPEIARLEQGVQITIPGKFTVLQENDEGKRTTATVAAQDSRFLNGDALGQVQVWAQQTGMPVLMRSSGGGSVKCACSSYAFVQAEQTPQMICALTLGEACCDNGNKPSMILCRAGAEDTVWTLAKAYGSTVQAIEKANHLTENPPEGKMLLIPCYI